MPMTCLAGLLAGKSLMAFAAFQADGLSAGDARVLVVSVVIIAAVMLLIALVIIGIAVAALKAFKEVMAEVNLLKAKALPLIEKSNTLVTDLTPKINKLVDELAPKINDITTKVDLITGHVEHIAGLAKEKADEFAPTVSKANETIVQANETVQDANRKTQAQIKRVDGIISSALDATVRLGVAIEKGIAVPGRELAGIVQGVKIGFETFLSGAKAFGSGAVGTRPSSSRPAPVPPVSRGPVPVYPGPEKSDHSS